MDSFEDIATLLQRIADNTDSIHNLEPTEFVQLLKNFASQTVGDPDKTTNQRIEANTQAMLQLGKMLGISTDRYEKFVREFGKDLKSYHTSTGQELTGDQLYLAAGRRMNEAVLSNNILNFDTKKAKKSESAQKIKKEYSSDVAKEINNKLDECTEKLIAFLTGELSTDTQNKKSKSFIANLITALAQSKAVGGFLEDLVKLVTFMGASILSQFGDLGRVFGAALIAFGPSLLTLMGKGMLDGLTKFLPSLIQRLTPLLFPLTLIAMGVAGLLMLFDNHEGKTTGLETPKDANGYPIYEFHPGLKEQGYYDSSAGYLDQESNQGVFGRKNKDLTSDMWESAKEVKNFAVDPNTGMISNSALMAGENIMGAWNRFAQTYGTAASAGYEVVDLSSDKIKDLVNTKEGMKVSATNRWERGDRIATAAIAGKDMGKTLEALADMNKAIGASSQVYEFGLQTAGSFEENRSNKYDLRGSGTSLNSQNAMNMILGDFKLDGKKVNYDAYRNKVVEYLTGLDKRTPEQERLYEYFMGSHKDYKNGEVGVSSLTYRSVHKQLASDMGVGQEPTLDQGNTERSNTGDIDYTKLMESYNSDYAKLMESYNSGDFYTEPVSQELSKQLSKIPKESDSKDYSLPDYSSPVQIEKVISPDLQTIPQNPVKSQANSGIDPTGTTQTSDAFKGVVSLSWGGADMMLGIG